MILLLYVLFFCSLFFSWRAISSISVGFLLILSMLHTNPLSSLKNLDTAKKFFLYACLLFFLVQFIPFSPGWGTDEFWKNILLKSGVIVIPLMAFLTAGISQQNKKFLLQTYCLTLFGALLSCLFIALKTFAETNDSSTFFYHSLLSPFNHHAVYFSLFTFTAIMLLMEEARSKNYFFRPVLHYSLALFFSLAVFLLSSKQVIAFLIVYTGYHLLTISTLKKNRRIIILSGIIIMLVFTTALVSTSNPVGNRIRDLTKGSFTLHRQEQFHPGVYFNGIQFRLLPVKLVPGILTEQNSWWAGTGSARAQQLLDEKYLSMNMYAGDGKNDKGYLGLNTHNQFLESLLKQGIIGLFAFTMLFIAFISTGRKNSKNGYLFAWLILGAYSFIESILETQYGIILFAFFPVFLPAENKKANLSGIQSD